MRKIYSLKKVIYKGKINIRYKVYLHQILTYIIIYRSTIIYTVFNLHFNNEHLYIKLFTVI